MKKRFYAIMLFTLALALLVGCQATPEPTVAPENTPVSEPTATTAPAEPTLEGKLIVFHAGSLTVPMQALTEAFQANYPGVTFETEASGSNAAARKISELGREADLMMSADYTVIDKLLIPDFAGWNVRFARNTMVIAYTDQSQYADEINADNWYDILPRDGVIYGHSEPDADPCGYRTLLVWQLAEKHYGVDGLNEKLIAHCPEENIRPKSVELIALLESGDMDYAWEYRSVAVQHGLKFVELPDEINLSMVEYTDFYAQASVDIAGAEPGETMTMVGKPIVYGLTIPKNAPSPELAMEFVRFVLGPEGQAIMDDMGQPPIIPATSADLSAVPADLHDLVVEAAAAPAAKAALTIGGEVENEAALSLDDLKAMDVVQLTLEHPKKGNQPYEGVRLSDLLALVQPGAEATTLVATADDGYSAEVDLADVQACADCLLSIDGDTLSLAMPGLSSKIWVKGVVDLTLQ